MRNFNRIAFGVLFFLVAVKLLYSCTNVVPENTPVSTETKTEISVTPPVLEPTGFKADWDGEKYYRKVNGKTVWYPVRDKEYTKFLVDALNLHGQGLLKLSSLKDANLYCPKFSSLSEVEKMQFYVMLFSTMSRWESGFDHEKFYREDFSDPAGDVISRGLLQMSQISSNANRYKCGIKKAEDLYDPKTNLECAVKIMTSLVLEDRYLGTALGAGEKSGHTGGSRYWSVLRKYVWDKKAKIWKIRPARVDIQNKVSKVKGCI